MSERKHILSLNLKKLFNRTDDLKIILILQNEILLFDTFCERVFKRKKDIPRYGKTKNNSFLETVCSTILCANCLFKNILMHLSTKVVGK